MNQRKKPKAPASKRRAGKKGSPEGPPPDLGPLDAQALRKARLLNKARQIMQRVPMEQPDKVAALRQAIEQGEYHVDSRELANILIAKLLLER